MRAGRARLQEWVEDILGNQGDVSAEEWTDYIMTDLNLGIIEPEERYKDVTRITVVGARGGVLFERYDAFPGGVNLYLQDEGRTLKIFPTLMEESHE